MTAFKFKLRQLTDLPRVLKTISVIISIIQ